MPEHKLGLLIDVSAADRQIFLRGGDGLIPLPYTVFQLCIGYGRAYGISIRIFVAYDEDFSLL